MRELESLHQLSMPRNTILLEKSALLLYGTNVHVLQYIPPLPSISVSVTIVP